MTLSASRMPLTSLEARVLAAGQGRDAELQGPRRKAEGIVHTPPELARFIARAADELAMRELAAPAGLADPSVALIDPACGPGAFFAAARAVAQAPNSAPAAVLGVDRDAAALERCRGAFAEEPAGWPILLRCEDTVQDGDPEALARLGERLVVLGNPPWIGSAQAVAGPRLGALLEELRCDEHGARLDEKKLGVLSDAYVRFLAFVVALARAARGGAVVGLVTNSSYLDGPVHRGLRGVLSRTFDAIDIVDLGGSALLARERMQRDGNVFGVRTPAAVLLAVRRPGAAPRRSASVRYARVHGTVHGKLEQLAGASLAVLGLEPIACSAPAFRFVPERAAPPEYRSWPSLAELMPFHREGVQTNRDAAVVDASRERLCERLLALVRGEAREDMADAERALAHYDPARARRELRRYRRQRRAARGVARPHRVPPARHPLLRADRAAVPPAAPRPRAGDERVQLRARGRSQGSQRRALAAHRGQRGHRRQQLPVHALLVPRARHAYARPGRPREPGARRRRDARGARGPLALGARGRVLRARTPLRAQLPGALPRLAARGLSPRAAARR